MKNSWYRRKKRNVRETSGRSLMYIRVGGERRLLHARDDSLTRK